MFRTTQFLQKDTLEIPISGLYRYREEFHDRGQLRLPRQYAHPARRWQHIEYLEELKAAPEEEIARIHGLLHNWASGQGY